MAISPKLKAVNEIANLDHNPFRPKDQTDTAYTLPVPRKSITLQAIAVCISLNGDPNDTCGLHGDARSNGDGETRPHDPVRLPRHQY